jgi:hypothetical protein
VRIVPTGINMFLKKSRLKLLLSGTIYINQAPKEVVGLVSKVEFDVIFTL